MTSVAAHDERNTLSAEDLGILLQQHWKYGMSTFINERRRVQMSLLMLFSAFTGSRPATLLADDNSSSNDSQECLADDLFNTTLVDDSDGGTLVGGRLNTSFPFFTEGYGRLTLLKPNCMQWYRFVSR
jgi:hypothetical protein